MTRTSFCCKRQTFPKPLWWDTLKYTYPLDDKCWGFFFSNVDKFFGNDIFPFPWTLLRLILWSGSWGTKHQRGLKLWTLTLTSACWLMMILEPSIQCAWRLSDLMFRQPLLPEIGWPPIDLTTVPSVYHDLHGEVLSLPPHQPYDCAIELLPVCVQSTQ